jgi:Uma2 family endonuclease
MTTLLKIGPADNGRPMSLEEFLNADGTEGYHYELIDGKLSVSPVPNLPENRVEEWISEVIRAYAHQHPHALNYVSAKARLFVPGREHPTAPEPDLAAYRDFPTDLPLEEVNWQDVSPVLVVEVISPDDPDKDLVRNVALYLQIPTVQEYWIFDTRQGASRPTMLVYRRRDRRRWRKVLTFGPGSTYTTDLLPDFSLVVDPRS